MKNGKAFWEAHLAAIKREAISKSAYAERHGIAVKRLYYWQRKLKVAEAAVRPNRPSAFVSVRVANVTKMPQLVNCTLVLGSGMRLEMTALPSPEWLAAVGGAAQGER